MNRMAEILKYENCYRSSNYRQGERRRHHIEMELPKIKRGSLLDVGCGRGETIDFARSIGFDPVWGVEAVGYLCDGENILNGLAHNLPFPDKSFDVVTMFDVMEHLIPEDTSLVCSELKRVARRDILMTIHNGPSNFHGLDLHINRLASYEAWLEFLVYTFAPARVYWLPRHDSISEMFRVNLNG